MYVDEDEATGTPRNTFHFTQIDTDDLSAEGYTLVTLVLDQSGSVKDFARDEEKAIKAALEALHKSPRADTLMIRLIVFADGVTQVHGFKLLQDCSPASYDGILKPEGLTALFDATIDGLQAMTAWGRHLQSQNYSANGIIIVVTDGANNSGAERKPDAVAKAMKHARLSENLESIISILVGVNTGVGGCSGYLKDVDNEAGFDQYVDIKDATPDAFAKFGRFVSASVSSQSQARGSGGPSQTLSF